LPGQYSVTISAHANNVHRELLPTKTFTVRELKLSPEVAEDRESVLAFQRQAADLYRRVSGAVRSVQEIETRIESLDLALLNTPAEGQELHSRLLGLRSRLNDINILLLGDEVVQSRREAVPWSLQRRTRSLLSNWGSQSPITGTDLRAYEISSAEYEEVSDSIRQLDERLSELEAEMNDSGAPWTPGRRMN
jgi:chromosome segregation ATPase